MIQFNAQFVRDYFRPLVMEMLSDMSKPAEETIKGAYLKRLFIPESLDMDKERQFNIDYFEGKNSSSGTRPFTKTADAKYRKYLLVELSKIIKVRIRLSGNEGMKRALLPSDSHKYLSNNEYTNTINQVINQLIRGIERQAISNNLETNGELSDEKKESLDKGRLKLVYVDGKEKVMTEDELKTELAKGTGTINALVEADLENKVLNDKIPSNPKPAAPEIHEYKTSELESDFRQVQESRLEQVLEESGLEMVGDLRISGDIAQGIVMDSLGNELAVRIQINSPKTDADKYVFIFKEDIENKSATVRRIPSSEEDIRTLFFKEGVRISAADAFKFQDEKGKRAEERRKPGERIAKQYNPEPKEPGLPYEEEEGMEEMKVQKASAGVEYDGIDPGELPLGAEGGPQQIQVARGVLPILPTSKGTRGRSERTARARRGGFIGAAPGKESRESSFEKGDKPKPMPTVMDQKKQLAERKKTEGKPERRQPKKQTKQQPARVARPQKKKKGALTRVLQGLGLGGTAAGIGLIGWGTATASAAPEVAHLVLNVTMSCIGLA